MTREPIPVTVAALTPEGEHERQMASTIRVDESGIHVRVLDSLMPLPDSEGHAIADLLQWPRRMRGVMDGGQHPLC